jgi:hypothetical protein
MQHVPYRGSAPMVTDLLSGHVQSAFDNLPASIEHIRSGKLRALAVGNATRSDQLPNVPILGDFLPGFETSAFVAISTSRFQNQIRNRLRLRYQRNVTRLELDRLGGHSLCHEALEIRVDGPILRGHGVPAWL